MDMRDVENELVFGLDIGTRNVVGTVGYKQGKEFIVLAQSSMEHETRAMLDGQIHDIRRVGNTIRIVKEQLEDQIGQILETVCIAAAGRVLKTVTTTIEYEFGTETVVRAEDIHTLDLLGIDKAQSELKEKNDTRYKFYCVGYSVVKYYLNDEVFSSLEGHKAEKISEDIIVTFLPEDVVDGLYSAVALADLSVANMTLEPIAAIDVAIPENYRMLNIALVDVGAGTSDICITRDGSIIAYGMIPLAGDEITELIVQSYLVDFAMAEHIKLASTTEEEIEYTDIMMLKHTIKAEEVWKLTEELVDRITTDVADKIRELNGDASVSATFVVGGGGKIHGFTTMIADKLELPYERVALRGEEVLQEITFEQPDIKKDPLLVTPIGICLNYYEQKNSFIMVHFNGERVKLYDNGRLTIVDAAMQAGFPNEYLFPKRGKEINFMVNGSPRIARGEVGESAIVKVNDVETNINAPLVANSYITVEPSTAGREASVTIDDLAEYTQGTVTFIVNGKTIHCPKFVEVNGSIELSSYQVKEGDVIETRNFYTVEQLAEFMDVSVDQERVILVNNRHGDLNTLLYENFTIEWTASVRGADDFPESEPDSLRETGGLGRTASEKQSQGAGENGNAGKPQDGEGGWSAKDSHSGEGLQKNKSSLKEKNPQLMERLKKAEARQKKRELEAAEKAKKEKEKQEEEEESTERKVPRVEIDLEAGNSKGKVKREMSPFEWAGTFQNGPVVTDLRGNRQDEEEEERISRIRRQIKELQDNRAARQQGAAALHQETSDHQEPEELTTEISDIQTKRKALEEKLSPVGSEALEEGLSPVGSEALEEGLSPVGSEALEEKSSPVGSEVLETGLPPARSETLEEGILSDEAEALESESSNVGAEALEEENSTVRPEALEEKPILPKGAIEVFVNGEPIQLTGKQEYIFVDLFDAITFDLSASNGRAIITTVNGENAGYMQKLNSGDDIKIHWEEK